MRLTEKLAPGGRGVIATSSRDGVPNAAVYAAPHVIDEETVAFGMTRGRTFRNLSENPNAAFLYLSPGAALGGVRMTLALKEMREADPLLDRIRERAREAASVEAGDSIRVVAYFTVTELRPLV